MIGLMMMATATVSSPGLNRIVSVEQLYERCKATDTWDRGYCSAYIAGAYDFYETVVVKGAIYQRICVPRGTDAAKNLPVVIKYLGWYLDGNPLGRQDTAADVVITALGKAWPCRSR